MNIEKILKGELIVDTEKIINADIYGGGVNFAFSDYVYYDFIHGGGFNLHLPYVPYNENDEEAFKEFFSILDYTGMQYVRLQVSYTMWEPINDNDDPFNTDFDKGFIFSPNFKERAKADRVPENTFEYMRRFYHLLDYFEQKNIFVILGNWSGGTAASGFCPDNKCWLAPENVKMDRRSLHVTDVDEFAETFAAIMYHLIIEKGYTCVKGFSIYNEPEKFINYESVLAKVYNKCGEHLKRLGIRDKVLIQAIDGPVLWCLEKGMSTDIYEKLLKNCGENMDIISIHHYVSTLEGGTLDGDRVQGTISSRLINDFVKPIISKSDGRPVVIGELGTAAFSNPNNIEIGKKDIRLQIFNAEAVIASFNSGIKGYALWDFNTIVHPYFTMLDIDPDNEYHLIPDSVNYYPASLMIKYLPKGTNIVNTTVIGCRDEEIQRVYATVGVNNDDMTILMVNEGEKSVDFKINGIKCTKPFYYHYICREKTHGIFTEGQIKISNMTEVRLPELSIVVLTTYEHGKFKYNSER